MQSSGAYVDQIPAGAKPPPTAPPALKVTRGGVQAPQRETPAGLYVQVASVADQEQAVRASLELAQRLGSARPPFIRGEAAMVSGRMRLRMYAGPFADPVAAKRFCNFAIPGDVCLERVFTAPRTGTADPTQTKGPTKAGPQGKGD